MEVGENVSTLANVVSSPPDKMETTAGQPSRLNCTHFLFVSDVATLTVMS